MMMKAEQKIRCLNFKHYYDGKEVVAKLREKLDDVGIKFKEKLKIENDSFEDLQENYLNILYTPY
jgi:hypothetical protein